MKIKFTLTPFILCCLACISLLPMAAHSRTMEICKNAAQETNKLLPIKKDNLTIIREVGCYPGKPKIKFAYILEINAPQDIARKIDFSREIKPGVRNTFCSDPNIRPLLKAFDVDHRYYTKEGFFVGSFLLQSSECK